MTGAPGVMVVIPTFNPPLPSSGATTAPLVDLANTIVNAGYPLIISDDASSCTHDSIFRELPTTNIIRHTHNKGIARGLNDGLRAAVAAGATWLLTVDQDSILGAEYIGKIEEIADHLNKQLWSDNPPIGAVAPLTVSDQSGGITYPTSQIEKLTVTEEVIQSGTLWNVKALQSVGGFDEKLAIDAVDSAACLRLREAGFVIALTPDVTFEHNLGAARQVTILGRSVMVTGHSAKRRASIIRNRLRLAPAEFKQSPMHGIRTLRRVAVNEVLGWAMRPPQSPTTYGGDKQ